MNSKGRVIYYQLGGPVIFRGGGSEIFLVMYWGGGLKIK